YELNIPVVAVRGKAEAAPFACVSAPNVIVESVKPAEDGTDAFVLRLYECEGAKTNADVQVNVPVSGAVLTNLLEDEKEVLSPVDGRLSLSFRPFEIKTVKYTR
ncbi:MAG: alpha-mannosidase, partial [Clostridia bacterium]|nr:alpha-mannosidase [Clostridia bacterium]